MKDGMALRIGIGISKTKPNQVWKHFQVPGTTVKNAFANSAMEVKRSLSKLDNSVPLLDEILSGIRQRSKQILARIYNPNSSEIRIVDVDRALHEELLA